MYSNSGREGKVKLETPKVNFRKRKSKFKDRSSVFKLLHIWLIELLRESRLPTPTPQPRNNTNVQRIL